MKILHCSDIHLGKRPFGSREFSQKRYLDFFNVFNELIDKAIEEKVELFIVSGDLFDKKELTPDVLKRCEYSFEKLKSKKIKAFIIEGNHDNINNDTINSWTNYLEEKGLLIRGNYTVENEKYDFKKFIIKDINVFGIGYPGFAVDTVLEKLADILNPEEKNIVVVHTALGGGEFLSGLVSSDTIKKLEGRVIYIAGGHLHSYQAYPKNNPYFFIPGSLEYWNVLNERSDSKGAILFDSDTLTHKFINVNPRKRIKTNFYVENMENLTEEFKCFCNDLNLTGEELVIINIFLKDNGYVDVGHLEKILENSKALKGYIELRYIEDDEKLNKENNYYSVQEIEKNIVESWNIFGDSKNIVEYLQKFKEFQDEKDKEDDFFTLFDKMLEEELKIEDK